MSVSHKSHITRHTSHITHHTSYVTDPPPALACLSRLRGAANPKASETKRKLGCKNAHNRHLIANFENVFSSNSSVASERRLKMIQKAENYKGSIVIFQRITCRLFNACLMSPSAVKMMASKPPSSEQSTPSDEHTVISRFSICSRQRVRARRAIR